MPFDPHPPPDPEWPDHVRRIYEAGRVRIDELRRENVDADGTVLIPFRCYLCDERKAAVSTITGDGLPICTDCLPPLTE